MLDPCTGEAQAADLGYVVGCISLEARSRRSMGQEADILTEDWSRKTHEYDGLIYIMLRRGSDGSLVPLYIGKAETFGRGDGNLSANLRNLRTSKDKFARWGDNYAYHIGDLSAAVLTGHPVEKRNPKYSEWALKIFKSAPTEQPQLAFDVYFRAKAWKSTDVGIWPELSPIRLAFLEYLLIGVASTAFGGSLLNYEGRNRALSYVTDLCRNRSLGA